MPQCSRGGFQRLQHGIIWPSLKLLLLRLALGKATLLRHGAARNAALPLSEASKPFFFIQKVGLEVAADGRQTPRTPHSKEADKCLTAKSGQYKDALDGVGLYWSHCQDTTFHEKDIDGSHQEAQLFQFLEDGTVRSKSTGKCVRRMECPGGPRYMYDLGDCVEVDLTVKFQVSKAIASNMQKMKQLGTLVQAVSLEACQICGPFQLLERCGAGRPQGSSVGCQRNYQATPGWTKLASSYVGDAAAYGQQNPNDEKGEFLNDLFDETVRGKALDEDLNGIGETDDTGICGSYVTDAPNVQSFYYLVLGEAK